MKLAKGVVFFFLMGVLGSCFNPPEFPIEPHIELPTVEFKKGSGGSKDSIILIFKFKDGDGDLGIDEDNPKYSDYPFHSVNYFLAKDGELIAISTYKPYEDIPPIFKIDSDQSGKLVTIRTRNEPGYENLPLLNCINYTYDSLHVQEADKDIFDESYNLTETIPATQTHPTIYTLLDTFYIEKNTNHFNITIDFQIKNSNGTYTDYDLEKETCDPLGYDGRFPVLTESKEVPLEGTLRYSIISRGLSIVFQGRTLRLKVQIKDRALHLSNIIYTKDFVVN